MVSSLAAGGLGGSLVAGIWKIKRRGQFLLAASALIGLCSFDRVSQPEPDVQIPLAKEPALVKVLDGHALSVRRH